jgi:transposase InsO family protein
MKAAGQLDCEDQATLRALDGAVTMPRCVHCARGKIVRRSRPKVSTGTASPGRNTTIVQRLHTDTWGPSPARSHNSMFRYAQIFVHQETGAKFLFGMTTKEGHKTLRNLKTVLAILRKNGFDVKALMSDHGTEFLNHDVGDLLDKEGILHQLSAPYRQDGNGRAERPWRTLGEATVTMLSQSGLPKYFWYYGMSFAVSLANRRGDMSPYEQLRHVKPPIQKTAPFGCKVEARIDPSQRHKLDPRTDSCIYVGFDTRSKDTSLLLRLGDVAHNVKPFSRLDVEFFPRTFPYAQPQRVEPLRREVDLAFDHPGGASSSVASVPARSLHEEHKYQEEVGLGGENATLVTTTPRTTWRIPCR